MAISPTFQRYLATKNVVYDILVHEPTKSAMRTAEACRVSGDRVAKAVVLHDEYGYVLAILPASHQIRLDDLRRQLGLDVDLAAEYEIEELFDDCIPGAIPPVGECYGLETVVDDSIERQPEVYLEGGRPRDAGSHEPRAVRIAYRDSTARHLQCSRLKIAGRHLHG
jgi:Ala-tRNA(Pro) deacylase